MQPVTNVYKNLAMLANPRLMTILLLGFSSGLPLALSGSTLQAWFTVAGVKIEAIGALSLVGMPYVYKFLWAPLLDRFVPPLLGRRRGWILICQLLLVITIVSMAFMQPQKTPWLLGILAVCLAFFSASQDTAYDAYRTDILRPDERGFGSALNVASYRIAMLVSGALALIMADKIGWHMTLLIMAGLMVVEMLVTMLAPEPENAVKAPPNLMQAVVEPFREFLTRKAAIWILVLIVLYKICDAFALSLGSAFFIRGLGFTLTDVGLFYKVVGMTAVIIGSLAGGVLMTRMTLYRALLYFGILQGFSNITFMVLAMVGKNFALAIMAVFVENFCSGLGTVAFVAFLMALCDHRYTATQFALLSALSAIGRVFVGPLAGFIAAHYGWVIYFFWSIVLVIPALILLMLLKRHINFAAEKVV